jgi:hypothetical protein
VHQLPDDCVNHDLALAAGMANSLHRKIQLRILELITTQSQSLSAVFSEHLAPLYTQLAIVEATAWMAVCDHAIDAELNAISVADELECESPDVAIITSKAAKVSTALSSVTSQQRDALLSKPLVAFANNIAMDCQTEFDNSNALARWKTSLHEIALQQRADSGR